MNVKLVNKDNSYFLPVEYKNKLFAKLSYPQLTIQKDHRKYFYIKIESLVLSCLIKIYFYCSNASECVVNVFDMSRCKTFSSKTEYKNGNLNFYICYDVDVIKYWKYEIHFTNNI